MKHLGTQPGLYCFNQGWKFIEKDFSVLPRGISHADVYEYAKGGAVKGPAEASFDDMDWETVKIPHDWVTKKVYTEEGSPSQGYKKRGIGWYRVKFNLEEEDRNKQIVLEFEGMSCDAQIYINGMLMKRNFSGYNSFQVDITDMAQFGMVPNVLAIRIDASNWEGWWYEGAGIYRHVWLIKKAPIHIAYNGTWAKTSKLENGTWQVEVETTLENTFEFDKEVKLNTSIFSPDGNLVCQGDTTAFVEAFYSTSKVQEFTIEEPVLWGIENPALYKVKTEVIYEDQVKDYLCSSFGLRTISMDANTGFYLNDENIKLKGFCNHQDHAGIGVAVPYAIKEYRIQLLKDIGANAYRCAHNTDPEILEICDRLGMLVMEENRTFSTEEENLIRVKELVRNARNHPSVIMYSVFNEEPLQGTSKGRRIAGRIRATMRSMDDTRPILGAFNGGYMEPEGASTILDITGINYNPGRYDDYHAKYPDKPMLGSETASAFMVRGEYETDYDKHIINSYDEHAAGWGSTVKDAWRVIDERPFVAGTFVWTGFDYLGEPTPFVWPSVATFFGTYDSCGFRKDACYLYDAFWKPEPMVHVLPHWTWNVEEGTPIKVMTFTNCEEVELYLNDTLLERKKCDKYEQATFQVPYKKGTLKAIGYKNGQKVAEDTVKTAKEAVKFEVELSKNTLIADQRDAVAVNVFALDEDGVKVPDASCVVHFKVEGGAVIQGVGNGDPNSHEPDVADYRKFFHGCVQAILLNTSTEDVSIEISAEGMESARVEIKTIEEEQIPYVQVRQEQIIDGWGMYYRLYDEMPKLDFTIIESDMNSYEPISFEGGAQVQLSKQYGKYGVYRVIFNFDKEEQDLSMYFASVRGDIWVYMDGELLCSREEGGQAPIEANLPSPIKGQHVVMVVVKNTDKDWAEAGICMPVSLKK